MRSSSGILWLAPNGGVFKLIHHLFDAAYEIAHLGSSITEQAPVEVSLLMLESLGMEEVVCQPLNDYLVVLLGIVSICFSILIEDVKCFLCQDVLCYGIHFWPSPQTLSLDNFL